MPSAAAVPAQPARRTVLRLGLATGATGLLVTGVSGCRLRVGSPTSGGASGAPTGGSASGRTADEAALDAAAGTAQHLQELYVLAGQARPDLAAPLARLAADHTAQLRALDDLGAEPEPSPTSTVTSPAASATSGSSGSPGSPGTTATQQPSPAVPTRATAISVLSQAERAAATAGLNTLAGLDGRTARLLASIAACSSAHVALLARLPGAPAGTGVTAAPPKATKRAGA